MFESYILFLQMFTIGTGLICLWRRGPVLLWVIWGITVVACINESLLVPNAKAWWGVSRNVFYNAYAIVDISTWSYLFYHMFKQKRTVRVLVVWAWMGLVLYKLYEIFQKGSQQIDFVTLILFCAICLMAAVYYFSIIMNNEFHDLQSDCAFWICCASLCFHSVLMVNLITVPYVRYWEQDFAAITFNIIQVLAITCYNVFICLSFLFSTFRSTRFSRQTLS